MIENYSEGILSIKFPYSIENVEKIRKINGREWIESDKIWTIPNKKDIVRHLFNLFENYEIKYGDTDFYSFNTEIFTEFKNELKIRNYSTKTQKSYLSHVKRFLKFHNKPIEDINNNDVRSYLLNQITELKSAAYVNQTISALRFLFIELKNKSWLKSGIIFDDEYYDTEAGTPQGGIISPCLCNLVLSIH